MIACVYSMIKKDINQNDILNSELLNIIDYNYIFDEKPIKRIKTKPVLENWLSETKDPVNKINETLKDSADVLKRLPNLPEVMDKANQALSYLASGKIPHNSNSYEELNSKKLEMVKFRNQTIIGLLLLVILGLLVF